MKRLLFGPRAAEEALRADPKSVTLILHEPSNRSAQRVAEKARKAGVAVTTCGRDRLELFSKGLHHQGVVAITGTYPYVDLDELLRRASASGEPPLLLALDQVMDVHNVGSLLRSAVSLGAQGVILCRHGGAQVTPAAVRVSAGASEHATVARVTNLVRTIERLSSEGITVIGLDAQGSSQLLEEDLSGGVAFVLGSEGSGLRRLVKRSCHLIAMIPQSGPLGSLNVGVAGAIAMYEARRQRKKNASPA